MRITLYKTVLDAEMRTPCLVKENAVNYGGGVAYNNAADVAIMLNNVFNHGLETEELVYLLCFDIKRHLIGVFNVSHGTDCLSAMNPREILMKALLCGAHYIIVAHNHPSGDTTPSNSDISSTQRLKEACGLVGIGLTDSIVLSDKTIYSMKDNGDLA